DMLRRFVRRKLKPKRPEIRRDHRFQILRRLPKEVRSHPQQNQSTHARHPITPQSPRAFSILEFCILEFCFMNWSAIASIFLALAVGLGAFGAHGLRDKLDAYSLDVWNKAVFYHFIHGLGMLIASLMPRISPVSEYACWAFAAGILIFSGSLYTLAAT